MSMRGCSGPHPEPASSLGWEKALALQFLSGKDVFEVMTAEHQGWEALRAPPGRLGRLGLPGPWESGG